MLWVVVKVRLDALSSDTRTRPFNPAKRRAGGILAGLLFTVIATFCFLRDGRTMVHGLAELAPAGRHDDTVAIAGAIVSCLSGCFRGAAVLGTVEGITVGITVAPTPTTRITRGQHWRRCQLHVSGC